MSDRHWMPFYVADYLGDTMHLSTEEHGAYLLLIFHYWRHECLPDDDEILARLARVPMKRWRAIRPTIRAFFSDGWVHQRVEYELERAREKSARLAENGRKGGKANAKQMLSNGLANGEANAKQIGKQNTKQTGSKTPSKTEATHSHSTLISEIEAQGSIDKVESREVGTLRPAPKAGQLTVIGGGA